MNDNYKIIAEAGKNDSGKRADRIIRTVFSNMNLSSIYKEIRSGRIRVNDRKIKPACRLEEGDVISIHISVLKKSGNNDNISLETLSGKSGIKKADSGRNPLFENIPTNNKKKYSDEVDKSLLFENDNIIAVSKKRGLLVHSGDKKSGQPTLEDYINSYLEDKIPSSLTFRPGPLHRLDRNTSGIVLFGKSIEGARTFSEMLKNGKTEKYYIALFDGIILRKTKWENRIYQDKKLKKSYSADISVNKNSSIKKSSEYTELIAKTAVTVVTPIVSTAENTLALVNIPTGRYHQIRKQGELNSHPLTGDSKYGGKADLPYYLLHAYRLVLNEESPVTGFKEVTAPLPDYFIKNACKLFGRKEIEKFRIFLESF